MIRGSKQPKKKVNNIIQVEWFAYFKKTHYTNKYSKNS